MAEHYKLHFQPHLSVVSSFCSKLYKTEKFADVILYSSKFATGAHSDIPTVAISAHRFILASCSQYFEAIFEMTPIPNTGPLVIVLPPNLSYRAIEILVEYMYNGEATVTEDLLNEVLTGGQFLMIRGLYNTASASALQSHSLVQQPPLREESSTAAFSGNERRTSPTVPTQTQHQVNNYNLRSPPVSSRYINDAAVQHIFRSSATSTIPKSSPAILRSPKSCHRDAMGMPAKLHNTRGISINKNVAIDPGDKCCYQGPPQHDIPVPTSPHAPPICNIIGCNSCTLPASSALSMADPLPMQRRHSSHSAEQRINRDYIDQQSVEGSICEPTDIEMGFDNHGHRDNVHNRVIAECCASDHRTLPRGHIDSILQNPTSHSMQDYIAIKQEPNDWSNNVIPTEGNNSNNNMVQPERPRSPSPSTHHQSMSPPLNYNSTAVKMEISATVCNTDDVDEEPHDYSIVCKICHKRYKSTDQLLCHMNSHNKQDLIQPHRPRAGSGTMAQFGNMENVVPSVSIPISNQPKKRRRISQQENNIHHLTLVCDICNISFEAAAEWVRHMSNQHTEMELAVFNSKQNGDQKGNSSTSNANASTASLVTSRQINHKKYGSRHAFLRSNGGIESILTPNDNRNANPELSTSTAASSNSTAISSESVGFPSSPEKSSQKSDDEPNQ